MENFLNFIWIFSQSKAKITNRVWPSSVFTAEEAFRKSHICTTGEWSSSLARASCVAISGFPVDRFVPNLLQKHTHTHTYMSWIQIVKRRSFNWRQTYPRILVLKHLWWHRFSADPIGHSDCRGMRREYSQFFCSMPRRWLRPGEKISAQSVQNDRIRSNPRRKTSDSPAPLAKKFG